MDSPESMVAGLRSRRWALQRRLADLDRRALRLLDDAQWPRTRARMERMRDLSDTRIDILNAMALLDARERLWRDVARQRIRSKVRFRKATARQQRRFWLEEIEARGGVLEAIGGDPP